jgi:serine/threonine protein kinase
VVHGDLNDVISFLTQVNAQLHSKNNLSQVNILISEDLVPKLADFGLTLVGESSATGMTTSYSGAGTARWKPPESLTSDQGLRRTTSDDVWAFGCLIIAVRFPPFLRLRLGGAHQFTTIIHR